MHKNIEAIKKNESSPRVINNIFDSIERSEPAVTEKEPLS